MKILGILVCGAAVAASVSTPSAVPFPDVSAWNIPTEPFRIVGPVHFVGTSELAAYLVATPAGHVLIDGGLPESAPLIERSIRTLGFDPKDIRTLLITQAHFDHVGSLAHFERLSRARVEVMDGDVALVESGGRTDYLFAATERAWFEPVEVDRSLRDGDTVSLGGIILTARRTPGHTPGSTTWLATVEDGGRRYAVLFSASTGINPGTQFVERPSYPGIAEDYAASFRILESLQPEVFLGSHTGFFAMEEKRKRLATGGPGHPFVDPDGFRAHVAARKRAFEEHLERERAAARRAPAVP